MIFYASHVTFYLSGYLLSSVNVASYIRHNGNKYVICSCDFHFMAISDLHEVFCKVCHLQYTHLPRVWSLIMTLQ